MVRRTALLALAMLASAPRVALADPAEPLQDKKAALDVMVDTDKVDFDNHQLEVKLSRPASKVRIKVVGDSGTVLAEVEKPFDGAPAGTALIMTWTPASAEHVARIEIYGYDTEDHWKGVAITPWSLNVDHEQVNFETDSDVIRPSEVPKLQASRQAVMDGLAKLTANSQKQKPALYILGNTDTMGTAEHNIQLSRRRARAIAAWFKANGFPNAVAWEGVGSMRLLVKTADQVDEPRNRRVDYLLSWKPLPLPSGEFSWKPL
jgi:outer membrane protein OmpA-like peptidoglycan-associated protein